MEFRGDSELLWALEFDGLDECDANSLGKADTVAENVSRGVDDWEIDKVGVIDHWLEKLLEPLGLLVKREDVDKDIWEVEVLDTEVDPVILLDLIGVAELLDEIVWDLHTIDEPVAFTVRVPVFDTDVDTETEFVEDILPLELGDELLVDEGQLDRDADAVEDWVEQAVVDSDLLWEDDPE